MSPAARLALALIAGASLAAPAAAQVAESTVQQAREVLGTDGTARHMVSLINFSSLPAVSFATFTVDRPDNGRDAKLDGGKIPVEFDVPIRDSDVALQVALSFGLVNYEEPFDLPDGSGGNVAFESERRVWSALAGGGPKFPVLFEGFTIAPIIMGGIAAVDSEARFFGRAAEIIDPNTEAFLLDWTVDTAIVAGTLQFQYDHRDDTAWTEVWAQATHSYVDAFNYPDESLNFSGHSDVFGGFVRYNRNPEWQLWGQPLGWHLIASNTTMGGEDSSALGFNYIFGAGGGLTIFPTADVIPFEGARLTAQGMTGDNITGISISASLIW